MRMHTSAVLGNEQSIGDRVGDFLLRKEFLSSSFIVPFFFGLGVRGPGTSLDDATEWLLPFARQDEIKRDLMRDEAHVEHADIAAELEGRRDALLRHRMDGFKNPESDPGRELGQVLADVLGGLGHRGDIDDGAGRIE